MSDERGNIRNNCPECRADFHLWPRDILLVVHDTDPWADFYGFTCPECGTYSVRPAPEDTVRLLILGGAGLHVRAALPVLTEAECDQFAAALAVTDNFDAA